MKSLNTVIVLACLVLSSVGCEKQIDTDVSAFNKANISRLKNAYIMYMAAHDQVGPADEEQLKKYMRENKAAVVRLKRMGVSPDDIDSMFSSDRDGEPFVIRWGLKGLADHAMIFEATGVDGKRMVAFGTPREVDDSEYEGLLSGKIKPERPAGLTEERIETTDDDDE